MMADASAMAVAIDTPVSLLWILAEHLQNARVHSGQFRLASQSMRFKTTG